MKGIVGSAIKVNIVKHESSDQHALELHVHATTLLLHVEMNALLHKVDL